MEHRKRLRRSGVASTRASGRALVAAATVVSTASLGLWTASTAVAADTAPQGTVTQEAVSVYPADSAAQNFNAGPAGWKGYQEYSAGCWGRGVSCPKIHTLWQPTGGPKGAGDGYLRFKGNSPAVYGFPYGQGAYTVWSSPSFNYTNGDAKSWTLDLDWRTTHASYAIGWNGLQVEVVDAKTNRVVRTAMPAKVSVPTGHWSHVHVPFDGSVLKAGRQYKINVVAIDYYGPSAATLGHHDVDNVSMKVSNMPGEEPVITCKGDYKTDKAAFAAAYGEGIGSFCSMTEPAGNSLKPAAELVDKLAKQPGIAEILKAGQGFFVVFDRASGQAGAWAVGRENIPSSDPRRIYSYIDGGNVGGAADFALYFVVSNPDHVVKETFGHPGGIGGAIQGIIKGQLDAAGEVLANPVGEALDVDPGWSLANVMWHLTTATSGTTGGIGGSPGQGLPAIPGLPELPGGVPGIPSVPGVPSLPGLPGLPTGGVPNLPGLPTGGVPNLPGTPNLPGVPDLPLPKG